MQVSMDMRITAVISLYNVFIIATESVHCAVPTGYLKFVLIFMLKLLMLLMFCHALKVYCSSSKSK